MNTAARRRGIVVEYKPNVWHTTAERITALFCAHPDLAFAAPEIARAIRVTTNTARTTLKRMRARRQIERVGYGRYTILRCFA